MNKVLFKKISILSLSERKGFSFDFSDGINFIHGTNDTGKSSLIKSLYYTLGGDVRLDDSWKKQDIISKVTILNNHKQIDFYRKSSLFCLIVKENNIIKKEKHYNRISDLAEGIKDLFGFNLLLTLKKNKETILANPASYYFPFYIDQDDGWHNVLDSFKSQAMYIDWQKNALQYHSGIKPKEYYALNGELKVLNLKISELEKEIELIKKTQNRFEKYFGEVVFDIDIEFYINKIDYFIEKCVELEQQERSYRLEALTLYAQRSLISDEILNIENEDNNTLLNIEDDVSFALESYKINKIKGTLLENKMELYEEKEKLDKKINALREEMREKKVLSNKIKSMLSDVKDNFSIKEIIDSQAYKNATVTFKYQITEIENEISEFLKEKIQIESAIKKYTDRKRTTEINDYFQTMLNKVQQKLRLPLTEKSKITNYRKLTTGKTGSRSPRAIFAYHYAMIKTIDKYSSLPMLPIVIDSPKQQDLDDELSTHLIQFCLDDLAEIAQVIIGAVKPEKNMHGHHSINLVDKFSLLSEKEYHRIYEEIMPEFQRVMFNQE